MDRLQRPRDPGYARLPRRHLLRAGLLAGAAASGGALLAACAGLPSLAGAGGATVLRVTAIGFPGARGQTLAAALRRAAQAYVQAGRGQLALEVATSAVPPASWFLCGGSSAAASGCSPAAPEQAFTVVAGASLPPNVLVATGGTPVAVQGRTALNFVFGHPDRATSPIPAPGARLPDLILAYDIWAYWLAPLASDLGSFWKVHVQDHAGVPDAVAAHGQVYAPHAGTFFGAVPLLRSPLSLFGTGPAATAALAEAGRAAAWTWDDLVAALPPGPVPYTGQFSVVSPVGAAVGTPTWLAAQDASAALVCAYGGAVGAATAAGAAAAYGRNGARQGLERLLDLFAGGRLPENPAFVPFLQSSLSPGYVWDPLGGPVARDWTVYPLPAGAVRRAVPAAYFGAYVPEGGHVSPATDFAAFLLTSAGQGLLAAAQVGSALRSAAAESQLPGAALRVEGLAEWLDPTPDLTLADVMGTWMTDANRTAMDAVSDGFSAALTAIESPLATPAQLGGLLQAAG